MKRVLNVLSIVLVALFVLSGCAKFEDGTSVWADNLWIVPSLTAIGSLIFLIVAYLGSKSNSTTTIYPKDGGQPIVTDNTGNVPIYKFGQFYFAVALAVATIIIILMVTIGK